jgi:hypothetical protein
MGDTHTLRLSDPVSRWPREDHDEYGTQIVYPYYLFKSGLLEIGRLIARRCWRESRFGILTRRFTTDQVRIAGR